MLKFCARCGHDTARNKAGVCKACAKANQKKWELNHPDKVAELNQRRKDSLARKYAEDPVAARGKTKEWRKKNPEKVRTMKRNYRLLNADKVRAAEAKW